MEFFVGGGLDHGVVGRDEVDTGVVEVDGGIGVVGDNDADNKEAVMRVIKSGIGESIFGVAGLGGDGDELFFVGFVERVLLRGQG